MENFKPGDTVLQVAGHHKGKIWLVVESTSGYNPDCVVARRWVKSTRKWSGNAYSVGKSRLVPVASPE